MKKIVCELCEGTEFTKEGGMFVCQGCGTKYSVEEAKSMMREVEGSAPVSTVAPVTAVPMGNPNQQQIDNMLLLATTAFEADNNQEAENYCNQVIALDAMNYKAWLLKGKAAGWQSTIQNQRITKAAHAFAQAIDFAPEDEKEAVKEEAVEQLKRLGLACISLRKNRFAKYPDAEELAGFDTDRKNLLNALMVLLSKGIATGIPDGYQEEIASLMNQAAVAGFSMVRDRYNSDSKPNRNDFSKALDEADNCVTLIQKAIDASDDDDDEDITRYENMIIIYKFTIDMKAYANYSDYTPGWQLTSAAKDSRRASIRRWEEKIKEIKNSLEEKKAAEARKAEEEKQARIKAYWEAHAEEKAALEAEQKELEAKKDKLATEISGLDAEIKALDPKGAVPSEAEDEKLRDQIRDLENQRSKLGMFAGKQKKQITEEIASLNGRRDSLKSKIEDEKKARQAEADKKMAPLKEKRAELQSQLDAATKRINAIVNELTKDPEA